MLANHQNVIAAVPLAGLVAATASAQTDEPAGTAALFDQNGERIVCGLIEPA